MLKKLLFLSAALAFVLPSFAQHQRRVLIEEFTNASCGPCAAQNPAFNTTVKANADFLTPIKYQTNFPGYDPMNQQNPSEVQTRRSYYSVNSVPNGRQNGVLEIFPMTSYNATMIQNAYNTLTPVTITLSHALTADYDSVLITLAVKSEDTLFGNLRLRVAVLEEEITFSTAPGTNGEKEFFQIMRKMVPNTTGTTTGNFSPGETKNYSLAWAVKNFYDLNQLAVSAWLQNDATKEVLQSARSLPIGGIPETGVNIRPNSFVCAADDDVSFTLVNTADAPLTTATLRYRVGTGAWTDYTWTGDLAPNASTQVVLAGTTIAQPGEVNLQVEVISSNNGFQTNLVDPVSDVLVKTLYDPASTLPFAYPFQSGTFPPVGWSVQNIMTTNDEVGWVLATNTGSGSSRSAKCEFNDIQGGSAYLTTPKLNLSQTTGNVTKLSFDRAYAYFSDTNFDSLRVEVSTNCGATWTTIFHDGKEGLATAPPTTSPFIPTSTQWELNEIDISDFNGTPDLMVRFVGESGWGNHLYIDNFKVSSLVGVKELTLSTFTLQPNPTSDFAQVRFGLEKPESIQLSVFNAQGTLVQSKQLGDLPSGEHAVVLDANNLPSGNYKVVLRGKEGVAHAQWVVVK